MFRFNKTPDVLTLFHHPKSESSNRILSFLKSAQTPSTPPQGTTTTAIPVKFDLDVVPAPGLPTPDQFKSIVDFLGGEAYATKILRGISTFSEGARALAEKESKNLAEEGGKGPGVLNIELVRPIVVDWNNGRVVVGGNEEDLKRLEEEVKKLVETLPED
ncbi:thioredoxin-like protein [Tirmania nivea]|nr:thioredoxin-like protein [Tirmania nivea]